MKKLIVVALICSMSFMGCLFSNSFDKNYPTDNNGMIMPSNAYNDGFYNEPDEPDDPNT
jgi:hypothetical protein